MELKCFVFCLTLVSIASATPSRSHLDDHWGIFKKWTDRAHTEREHSRKIVENLWTEHGFESAQTNVQQPYLTRRKEVKEQNLFKKSYNRTEEVARRILFEHNVQKIMLHNLYADLGKHSYRLGINKFTDWTREEFSLMHRFKSMFNSTAKSSTFLAPSNVVYPDEVDWRKEGLVTEVKNQGECGSCWAFSATGALEGQFKKKSGMLVSLSEQDLIDCCTDQEDLNGCIGGEPIGAFVCIKNNKGIATEDSYPYEGMQGECRSKNATLGARVTGFVTLNQYDELELKKAVATVGPISVAIDASQEDFRNYQSGIFDAEGCSPDFLNHGVLVVGYGTENGKDYWIIKNSWGLDWGEDGYIRIARNEKHICGVSGEPGYPLV